MNLYNIVKLEIDAASAPAALVGGHVDEVVDATADGEAEVTEGPQGGDPGGTCGVVILKGRANEI